MFWKKKTVIEEKQFDPITPVEPKVEPPKETTRKEVMEVVLINNKTDKEYQIQSDNDFGLNWNYTPDKQENYKLLVIQQKNNINGVSWTTKGIFTDFSISRVIWKTFDIVE